MTVKVSIDTSGASRYLRWITEDQMPFAAARALTWTAKDAQQEIKRNLPQQFILENKWTEKGIRITPADKKNLESEVYFKDEYMVKQEEAATLLPSGSHIAIPASSRGRSPVKTASGRIRKGLYPGQLLNNNKEYFTGTIAGTYGIWKRTGRKDSKGWPRANVALMYLLTPRARITKRWGYEKKVEEVVTTRLPRLFRISLSQALKD